MEYQAKLLRTNLDYQAGLPIWSTRLPDYQDQSGVPGQTFKRENNISLPSGWPGPGMLHHVSQPTWRIQFIYSDALGLALDNQKNHINGRLQLIQLLYGSEDN